MDVEDMFDLDTILFKQRKCRACGKNKDLTTDFYRSRPDRTSLSAWSYECKECTKQRVTNKRRENIRKISIQTGKEFVHCFPT